MENKKALAIVGYGKDGEIRQVSELVDNKNIAFAIYPLGTKFNKNILKDHRCKVIEVEIKFNF